MSEIKRPKAAVVKLPVKSFAGRVSDITKLKTKCLELANEIENLKDQTPWPNWSQCQADSLRDYCNDLPD
jgi:hypothetical protein